MNADEDRKRPTDDEFRRVLEVARDAARRNGASDVEADDVAQAIASRIWERWDAGAVQLARSRGRGKWEAYIRQASRNAHYDRVRSESRRRERETRTFSDRSAGRSSGASTTIEEFLGREMLHQVIVDSDLSKRQRTIFLLSFVDHRSPNEIAEQLGLSPRTVREHLQNASTVLAETLKRQEERDGG